MHVERITLTNFQCFGSTPQTITLDKQLTALIGTNGSGKTAALQALLRLFSVVPDQRELKVEDFHIPHDETDVPSARSLRIDVVFAFPELNTDQSASTSREESASLDAVPEFFAQMAAEDDGHLKLRIVLDAVWTNDGTVDGVIEEKRRIVYTLEDDFEDQCVDLRASERNRIQVVYVPATRSGERHVGAFLRGRLWRASIWSSEFRGHIMDAADNLSNAFKDEAVVKTVTDAISFRWQELHHLSSAKRPSFEPITRDLAVLVSNAELLFDPSPTGRTHRARDLSDGQQSLLHIAVTTATLDLENRIMRGEHSDAFDANAMPLPTLTILAVEEPENSLSPYFLSRVVEQLVNVTNSGHSQAVVSSHSASVMSRISPERVRHFRLDSALDSTIVNHIKLPDDPDAEKYIREAVQAYPELYFAQFVVLGEGASEEIVIPKLAAARDFFFDPSFVAIVPLGGRHTNHFWRLLNDLHIPHATLLDLDYGRQGGGEGRIQYVCNRLVENGHNPFDDDAANAGFTRVEEIKDLDQTTLQRWAVHLEKWGVYFSSPLDLDMSMLRHYFDAYTTNLDEGRTGPRDSGKPEDAVLGAPKDRPTVQLWEDSSMHASLMWYRYLFLSNSKPSTHLRAISSIDKAALINPPDSLDRLLIRISEAVDPA